MRHRIGVVLGAFALVAAVVLAGCQQPTMTSTTSTKVTTVVANVKGTVVDQNNQPVVGARVVFDTPNGVDMTTTTTTTTSKSISTATTDSMGNFSLDGLGSGAWSAMVYPPTTGSGATTAVNYTATQIGGLVDDLKTLLSTTGGTIVIGGNLYKSYSYGPVTLYGLGGSITGMLQAQQSGNPLQAIATKNVSMSLGTSIYYPTVSATGAITYLNYVTTKTDATGKFVFSNLPLKTYASGTVLKVETAAGAYTNSGTVGYTSIATLPAAIDLGLYGFGVLADISSTPLIATDTSSYPALALVSSSTVDAAGSTTTFDPTKAIVVTFNNTLTAYTGVVASNNGTFLQATSTTNNVSGTIAISGKTLTFTPASNLANATGYTLYYNVTDGLTTLSGTVVFTTANATTALTAPTLAVNTALPVGTNAGKYNGGDTTFYVIVTNYDSTYNYNASYMKSTDTSWSNANAGSPAFTNVNGTTANATITIPGGAWASGDTLKLMLSATKTGNSTYALSGALSITDGVAPTGATATITSTTLATASVAGSEVVSVSLGGEKMSLPTSTWTTALVAPNTGVTVTWTLSNTGTTAYGTIALPAGSSVTGNSLVITAKDAAGNQYVVGTTASTITSPTLN